MQTLKAAEGGQEEKTRTAQQKYLTQLNKEGRKTTRREKTPAVITRSLYFWPDSNDGNTGAKAFQIPHYTGRNSSTFLNGYRVCNVGAPGRFSTSQLE